MGRTKNFQDLEKLGHLCEYISGVYFSVGGHLLIQLNFWYSSVSPSDLVLAMSSTQAENVSTILSLSSSSYCLSTVLGTSFHSSGQEQNKFLSMWDVQYFLSVQPVLSFK